MKFLVFILIFLSLNAHSQANDEPTRSLKMDVPIEVEGFKFEVLQSEVPTRDLPAVVDSVLENEHVVSATLSYDEASKKLLQELESKMSGAPVREVAEEKLNALTNSTITRREQNGLRTLLLIRCVGIGTGLYVGTGSSLSVAAFAGLINYLMMEALYIPKLNGHMRGVDFVNSMMKKSALKALALKSDLSLAQKKTVEAFTNFSTYYAMNLIMIIPFLGMPGSDAAKYIHTFSQSHLYIHAVLITVATTLFMSSWKMAASRWEEMRREDQATVVSFKNQSRIVNGVDFIFSFINPGYWAGHLPQQIMVSTLGAGGFAAYFYYDLKKRFRGVNLCSQLF